SVGNWVRNGRQTVEQDPDNGSVTYDNIDIAKGTARIIANLGAGNLAAWINRQGSLWLIERTPAAYEVVTTVFPIDAEATSEFVMVESPHTLGIGGNIAVSSTA